MEKKKLCFFGTALFILLLSFTPAGIYQGTEISITTLHIPVIVGGMYLGPFYGAVLGIVWGASTILRVLYSLPTSVEYLFADPVVSVFPRALAGFLAALVFWGSSRFLVGRNTRMGRGISAAFAALTGTWVNAFFVVLMLMVRYSYFFEIERGRSVLTYLLTYIGGTNTLYEMLMALMACVLIAVYGMNSPVSGTDSRPGPGRVDDRKALNNQTERVRLIFQRFLVLLVTSGICAFLLFIFEIQTKIIVADNNLFMEKELEYLKEQMEIEGVFRQKSVEEKDDLIRKLSRNFNIGASGYLIIARENRIICDGSGGNLEGLELSKSRFSGGAQAGEEGSFSFEVRGMNGSWFCVAEHIDGYTVIAANPFSEVFVIRNNTLFWTTIGGIVLLIFELLMISALLQRLIISGIESTNVQLSEIGKGDLSIRVDAGGSQEFLALSEGINDMVGSIRDLMEQTRRQAEKELGYAREIQYSALPALDEVKIRYPEVLMAAKMVTAKEVGGDFYDVFPISSHHLGLLIADVSGKGVPAALYMMTAKALLRAEIESGRPLGEALEKVNRKLCKEASSKMFVTVFALDLDTATGAFLYVNAGHCKPLLISRERRVRYLAEPPNLFLGGMENAGYTAREDRFLPGETLLLYTDGVTEAESSTEGFFGEGRLEAFVKKERFENPQRLTESICEALEAYRGTMEQHDDMTLAGLTYIRESLLVHAEIEKLPEILCWVEQVITKAGMTMDLRGICLAVEEIFVNIASYAYGGDERTCGESTEELEVGAEKTAEIFLTASPEQRMIRITFEDHGRPFNPLEQAPQARGDSLMEQRIGGWGIELVKKQMDELTYCYEDGKNILTITKKWEVQK